MSVWQQLAAFLADPTTWSGADSIPVRLAEHLYYTGAALALAALVALPVGMLIGHTGRGAFVAIGIGNAARSFPTFGVLILVVLVVGLGFTPVLLALVVLGIPPILTATYAGIQGVDDATVTAARGMGMTEVDLMLRVETPVALPVILSGVRSATLQIVSTATIAAYVALGGFGRYVVDGLKSRDFGEMLTGALLVALLAVVLDLAFWLLGRVVVSPGVSRRFHRTRAPATPHSPSQVPA
ncbi:MAG: ABC transporter permease subunit [Actinomycetota bacterium]|nr:ABC transporter permease subunit [Actinomycetota bacterium]